MKERHSTPLLQPLRYQRGHSQMWLPSLLFLFWLLFTFGESGRAQNIEEDAETVFQGKRYLDLNISSLSRYEYRLERKQHALLSQLKKREHRFEQKLKRKDSAAYARYRERQNSFASIDSLSRLDSSAQANRVALKKPNPVIDSLKGVTSFITQAAGKSGLTQTADAGKYSGELSSLQGKLAYRSYINDLITKRTNDLKSLGTSVPGISGIEQKVFYAKGQMTVYKQMAEDPSKLEEKAYEYLQGQAGFEEGVDKAVNGKGDLAGLSAGRGGSLTAADLERMGYQTKRQVNAALQKQFGGSVGAVQQQMSSQLNSWQDKAHGITAPVKDAQNRISEAKESVQSIKGAVVKPSFKINPVRCLPFWKRIEKSYDFQTSRATADGKPAMLQLGAMAAYRQSPRLSAGVGAAASFGLGQSWSQIHLSFEGVGFRTFGAYEIIWGIGAYAGYERMYKRFAFNASTSGSEQAQQAPSAHSRDTYSESALLGLTKSYKINSKNTGAIQVLYDFWWREKGLNTPIVLRISNKI